MQLLDDNGLMHFLFPEMPGFDYGFNIYGLRNGSGVLLIDAAFRSQARAVNQRLKEMGLAVTHVLATHFHNDHISGLLALPEGISVLGSPEYGKTLSKTLPQTIAPVSFTEPFRFGRFTLRFEPAPGHSPCSVYTLIDHDLIHAGDNLMARSDGRRILPWVEREGIANHIASLEHLAENHGNRTVLLSHGKSIRGEDSIAREIGLRLHYLNAVQHPSPTLTLKEALPDHAGNWVCTEFFHQLVRIS
jgi:glyoxylase-like metal-dependent hydrolase (beta-lactamase superfamily II)